MHAVPWKWMSKSTFPTGAGIDFCISADFQQQFLCRLRLHCHYIFLLPSFAEKGISSADAMSGKVDRCSQISARTILHSTRGVHDKHPSSGAEEIVHPLTSL